ncbi:DUF1516 family protein [Alteribacillus sp. HJP-4]|uniref:DUF1516 family protein n=1 Tax=Alteribacillus sp. HJP-4 TaxID=2775394 RepID=UPI0035CD2E5B
MIIQLHLYAIIAAILLFLTVILLKKYRIKIAAIIYHQLLRLLYLFIALTGVMLLGLVPVNLGGLFKIVLGISTIAVMEIYFVQQSKHHVPAYMKIIAFSMIGLTVVTGLLLPQGISLP